MKRVVTYTNCQGPNVVRILAKHPVLSCEYDFEHAVFVENFALLNEKKPLPYDAIEQADLFIYQPTAERHGIYSTKDILTHLKPGCKTLSFPYIYNYAFWEVLVFADGDFVVGHSGKDYACLNHKPITELKNMGAPFSAIQKMILDKTLDWRFGERYKKTQDILRQKESECDMKVADFIDEKHRDVLLFHTQNHPSRELLKHVADQAAVLLGGDPALFPSDIPHPHYCANGGGLDIPIGWAAWNYYKFKFLPEPDMNTMYLILHHAQKIYNGVYADI